MTLDEALNNVTGLGFDTAPLIYFIERHPVYVDLMREIIRRVDTGLVQGYSSVITLTEVLTLPKRVGQVAVEAEYHQLLLSGRNFNLIPIDASLAEQAATLRARYNLRTPDALQLAAVLAANCQAFLTNDAVLKRVPDVRVLVLGEITLGA